MENICTAPSAVEGKDVNNQLKHMAISNAVLVLSSNDY
jgi:hypothetical protein